MRGLKLGAITIVITAISLFWVSASGAHLVTTPKNRTTAAIHKSQTLNLKHSRYVCNNGRRATKSWHCKAAKGWLLKEWKETRPVLGTGPFYIDSCTATILSREGGMNPYATNPTSGAYGGPQALPGYKMASAGSDWRTNIWTQIKWMLGYMNGRYGSPCGALAFWNANGYY